MADVAKVFMSGRSQAVRLPKKYRFDCDEVEVSREGDTVVLRPRKRGAWRDLLQALEVFDQARFDACFGDGREQPAEQDRAALDDVFR